MISISKEFNLGLLTGFILVVIIFALLILVPLVPRLMSRNECESRFVAWCHQCLVSDWSDGITILPEILPCMQEYNPLNMLLTKDSSCRYVKPICNYYGVE